MSKYLYLLSLILIVIVSCTDSTKIVDPPAPLVYQFSDYIHFETTNFYILAHEQDSLNARPEPFMYWDFSLGEPFSDINGNDVFDVGIDIFIITTDSTNMDLNHDGIYNGPGFEWSPEFPYLDVNGDGSFTPKGDFMNPNFYKEGIPYYDFYRNGKWDRYPRYNYQVFACSTSTDISSNTYSFKYADSTFVFWDRYKFDFWIDDIVFPPSPVYKFNFIVKENNQLDFQILNSYAERTFKNILDTNEIVSGSSYITVNNPFVTDSNLIKISLGEELEYNGRIFTDLMRIQISGYYDPLRTDGSFEFYFSKQFGFVAFVDNYIYSFDNPITNYFIDKF